MSIPCGKMKHMSLSYGPKLLSMAAQSASQVRVTTAEGQPAALTAPVVVDSEGRISFTTATPGRYLVILTGSSVIETDTVDLYDSVDYDITDLRTISSTAYSGNSAVYVDSFPRLTGETDDSPRIRRALQSALSEGKYQLFFSSKTYTLNSTITITQHEVQFIGAGVSTILRNSNNTVILDVTGMGFVLQNLQVRVTDNGARTNYPVRITGARPLIDGCYFDGTSATRRGGVLLTGGSMGTIHNCVFNHACIRIETWDTKVDKTYIWAMSCDFGVGIFNGAGNVTLTNVDVVPPLQSNANGLAGIYIDGASGKAFNTKMSDIYLDGNPTLDTRKGIYIGDGSAGVLMRNINANRMDDDCIVIDSAFNVVLDGYSGHTNNDKGRGSREIFITKTGTQSVENIRLSNIQCLRTTAVTGTAAPAIEVNSVINGSEVSIQGFNIKQPGAGGGYSVPEIVADHTRTNLVGTGTLSKYSASGNITVASGATSMTINLSTPYPMAYQPLASDISLQFVGTPSERYRIQFQSANQIYVPFSAPLTSGGTVHWRVDFRR